MNNLVTFGDISKFFTWNVEFNDIRNFYAYGAVVLLSKSSSERTYLDVKISIVLLLVYLGCILLLKNELKKEIFI